MFVIICFYSLKISYILQWNMTISIPLLLNILSSSKLYVFFLLFFIPFLFFLLFLFWQPTKFSQYFLYVISGRAIHTFGGVHTLRNEWFFFPSHGPLQQLLTKGCPLKSNSPGYVGLLTCLILYKSCSNNHSHCVWMMATAMSCLQFHPSQHSSECPAFLLILPPTHFFSFFFWDTSLNECEIPHLARTAGQWALQNPLPHPCTSKSSWHYRCTFSFCVDPGGLSSSPYTCAGI